MIRSTTFLLLVGIFLSSTTFAVGFLFQSPSSSSLSSSSSTTTTSRRMVATSLVVPSERDAKYGNKNMAQYLVDLNDAKATFDFCGGMMFQLVLSDALRSHLLSIQEQQRQATSSSVVNVADSTTYRMHRLEGYEQSAKADNLGIFHGREIRQVPWAEGGRGFVLHLSLADGQDPEGWTAQEIAGYDGWGHDSGRDWRIGPRLEKEGFTNFCTKFGPQSFALHHRFYLHMDTLNRMWLSAEDGCEGTPANVNPI